MLNFNDVKEVDRVEARQELSFDVERIPLVTEPNPHEDVHRLLVKRVSPREGDKENLGIVKDTRPHLPYTEIVDWVEDELNNANIKYKLKDSMVTKKGELYQEYIFDHPINTPDNEEMSPMLILRGSYVNSPMEADFGTYRFVCSNGVIVGDTISKIRVKPNVENLIRGSISDELRVKLNNFKKVENLYSELQDIPYVDYLWTILADEYLGTKIKKELINLLVSDGDVELTKEKIRSIDFADPEKLIRVVDSISAWEFYNMVTQVATIYSKSASARVKNYSRVSKDFNI